MPGLYGNIVSGNAIIPPNNNTSLYNSDGNPTAVNNNISVTGNITAAGYISAGGNVYGANFSTTGNVYAGNIVGNIVGNFIVPGNSNEIIYNSGGNAAASANLTFDPATNAFTVVGPITGGQITATGNVTGTYILGDGSLLTNLPIQPGTYSNANVAAYLPTYTGNITADVVSATGNITAAYLFGNGSQITGLPAGYSNADVATFLANFGSNTISTTGNVTLGYVIGDGSQLTNLPIQPGTYSNANVVSLLAAFGSNTLSTTGTVATGNLSVAGSILPTGNLTFLATPEARIAAAQDLRIFAAASEDLYLSNPSIAMANIWMDASTIRLAQYGGTGNTTVAVTGAVSATGNITGNYIIGDGSLLTNINAGNIIGAYSNANVANYLPTYSGTITAGNISATGNITAANLIGNGGYISNIAAGNITGTVANAAYATSAGTANTATTANTVLDAAQPNITSVGTLTSVTSTGNITGANLITGGQITATGNITGSYIIGNGSQLTGLPAGYSNANVAAYLPIYTGDYAGGNISVTGNVVGNILKTSGLSGNIIGANYVSANFYIGDGGLLSNIVGNYNDANVTALLSNLGSNVISMTGNISTGNLSATGNITGNYFIGNGSQLTGIVSDYGNANVNAHLAAFGSNTVSTTGNVTVGYIIGDGSQLTNLPVQPGTYSNANVANYLPTYSGNIGTLNSSILEVNGDQIHIHATNAVSNVNGISLNTPSGGSFVAIETPKVYIAEPLGGGGTQLQVAGNIVTQPGNVLVTGYVSASGNITGSYFIGNGSQLTGLPANYSNANVASFMAVYGSNTISSTGNITTTANIAGGNLLTTGTVYTPQVESATDLDLNTAGKVNVNGNIRVGDNNTDTQIATHGTSDLVLRTNEGAANQGSIRIYDGANGNIDIDADGTGTINLLAAVSATGNISAPYFIGNGSALTGIAVTANSFSTVAANGTNLVANTASSVLTITPGTNITITANATTNTITINSTATSAGDVLSPFLLMGA